MPSSNSNLHEPVPLWPEAPRLCPERLFPRYRYVPGSSPHPKRNPLGHSFNAPEIVPPYFPPERWCENKEYLYGIDLYHQSYFWESHEVWEGLWHLTNKEGPEGQFLQGLIQNAAALLKTHQGLQDAAHRLREEAHRRLTFVFNSGVCDSEGRYMGVSLPDLLDALKQGRPSRLAPAPSHL